MFRKKKKKVNSNVLPCFKRIKGFIKRIRPKDMSVVIWYFCNFSYFFKPFILSILTLIESLKFFFVEVPEKVEMAVV